MTVAGDFAPQWRPLSHRQSSVGCRLSSTVDLCFNPIQSSTTWTDKPNGGKIGWGGILCNTAAYNS